MSASARPPAGGVASSGEAARVPAPTGLAATGGAADPMGEHATAAARVLVAGIGYRNLRDHSAGVAVVDRLLAWPWPEDVAVEDLSYNPIAVVQRLEDEPPGRRFRRAVVVAGVGREGRAPGTVAAYRWDGLLPADEDIHRAITEAVTGVIALDNTLVVARYLDALPEDVAVVEVEPALHEFGEAFSPEVTAVFDEVCALVRSLATDPAAAARLPVAPLGGPGAAPPARAPARPGSGHGG